MRLFEADMDQRGSFFKELKAEANKKVKLYAYGAYLFLSVWAIASLISGNEAVRLQVTWLPLYEAILIYFYLHKMRSFVKSISNHHGSALPNDVKANNLTIYSIIALYTAKFLAGCLTATMGFTYPSDAVRQGRTLDIS